MFCIGGMKSSLPILRCSSAPVHPDQCQEEQQQSRKQSLSPSQPSLTEILTSCRKRDFSVFKLSQGYSTYALAYSFVQTVSILNFAVSMTVNSPDIPLAFLLATYGLLFVQVITWRYYYLFRKYVHSDVLTMEGKRIFYLGNMILFLQAISSGSLLLTWVRFHDECHSHYCLQDFPEHVLPLRLYAMVLVTSIGMPLFFSCHYVCVSFLSLCITILSMIVSVVLLEVAVNDIFIIFLSGIVIIFILFTYEGSLYTVYISFSKFEDVLREKIAIENKEALLKVQTEEMRNMIGNVAHDLRTPLQAFQSEMEVLSDNIRANSHDKESLFSSIKQLGRICNFMNMTINRSIDFTKASSGIKLNPSIESVNFSETLNWAVGCMAQQSNAKVPIVVLPIPKSIHNQLFTDKQWLMENMMCLLSNAQKFTTEGKITIRCTLDQSVNMTAVEQSSNSASDSLTVDVLSDIETGNVEDISASTTATMSPMLLIEVEDTGIGITQENQSRLFKPFMQAQRRTGGTGLGLYALSKRLESLGGDCGVRDRSDGASGSCFWISIPFKPDDIENGVSQNFVSIHEPSGRKKSTPRIVSLMSGFIKQDSAVVEISSHSVCPDDVSCLKILLVDDSPLIQKTTSRALKKAGHHVEVAQHGAECLKMLEASQLSPCVFDFDLILMDLQMPVMDGLEATRRIRALEKSVSAESSETSHSPHIIIIGVTANTEGEARVDCIESGMDGYMEKPLKVTHFHDYINSYKVNGSSIVVGNGGRKL